MKRGLFVVSLDLELLWGILDKDWRNSYRPSVLGGREAIPRILALFERYRIRATWAVVGLALCRGQDEALDRLGDLRERPAAPGEKLGDYIRTRTGRSEFEDPAHYAPSLVRLISGAEGQEIGTHTFTHYHCLEPGANASGFEADLRAAAAVARDRGHPARSLVLPRNQTRPDFVPVLARSGIECYRGTPRGSGIYAARSEDRQGPLFRALRLLDAYLPLGGALDWETARPAGDGPVDVPASRFLRPCLSGSRTLEGLRARRITREIKAAARRGQAYHLWWHPHNFGTRTELCMDLLEEILAAAARARDEWGMTCATMGEAARILRDAREGGA